MLSRRQSATLVAALILTSPAVSHAQAPGVLVPKIRATNATEDALSVRGTTRTVTSEYLTAVYGKGDMTPDAQARFAVLMSAPALSSPLRTSAWTAGVTSASTGEDVKIQFNACSAQFIKKMCDAARAAVFASVSGPLNPNGKVTELADLDGLFGTTLAEGGVTYNLTNATNAPAFSLKGSYARPEFDFRQSTTLAPDTLRPSTFSVSGAASFKSEAMSLSFGARYEDSYKGQDSVSVCTPLSSPTAGTVACQPAVLGAPAHKIKTVISIENRLSFGPSAAAGVTVSHDLRSGVTGFDVPIWVIPDASGGLASGVRIGYTTDKKKFTVTLFLATFSL